VSSTAFKDIQDDYFWTKKTQINSSPSKKHPNTYHLHHCTISPPSYQNQPEECDIPFQANCCLSMVFSNKKNIFQCRLFHQTSGFRDCHLNVAGTWGSVWKNPSISKVNRDDSWSFLLGRTCLIVVLKGNQELQTGNQFDANAYLRTIGIIWEFAHTFWRVNSNWEKCMFSMWTVSSPTTSNKNRVVAPNLKQN